MAPQGHGFAQEYENEVLVLSVCNNLILNGFRERLERNRD